MEQWVNLPWTRWRTGKIPLDREANEWAISLFKPTFQYSTIPLFPGPDPWPRPGMSRCSNGKSGIHKQWKQLHVHIPSRQGRLVYQLSGLILWSRPGLHASQDHSIPSHLPIPSRSRDGEGRPCARQYATASNNSFNFPPGQIEIPIYKLSGRRSQVLGSASFGRLTILSSVEGFPVQGCTF